MGVGDANGEVAHTDSSERAVAGNDDRRRRIELHDVLHPVSPMRLLSTKCDDTPQSNVMMNFSGPGVAGPARNECSMPDGGAMRELRHEHMDG